MILTFSLDIQPFPFSFWVPYVHRPSTCDFRWGHKARYVKSIYLIPWPHTSPPPSIPFAPGPLQMLSPLYTIYIHASPTFLHLSMDWIPLAHHLSSPFLPSLFSVP